MSAERPNFIPPRVQTVTCYLCGRQCPADRASGIDISGPNDYYPKMRPVCPRHGDDDS